MESSGAQLPLSPDQPPANRPAGGWFIAFEGGEGSGKSTQVTRLAASLRGVGHRVTLTREPGGSDRGEQIRALILAEGSESLDAKTEALLFAAARADHVTHVIRPALERGDVVITDRYLDSSIAYQGVSRGLGAQQVRDLSLWATDAMLPDLTFVLDVDPEVGVGRAVAANRLEAEPLEFHQRVRSAFLDLAEARPDRYRVIAAGGSPDEVHTEVLQAVQNRMVAR